MLSLPHLIIIFLVALVVLGPEKLPEVARTLGKVMSEFRKVTTDFRSALENEMNEIERQTREKERLAREAAAQAAASPVAALPPASRELTVEASQVTAEGETRSIAVVPGDAAADELPPSPDSSAGASQSQPAPNGESHPA